MTPDDIIDDILRSEGSEYTNKPHDAGGPTKYGITQATLSEYRGVACSPEDVENLQESEARSIYAKKYVHPFECIASDEARLVAVDTGVLHGVTGSIQIMQKALRVSPDGVLGPVTVAAIEKADGRKLALFTLAERLSNEGAQVTAAPANKAEDAAGWANRINRLIRAVA